LLCLELATVAAVQVGADSCTGDGGGPLLCPLASEPGRLIQVLRNGILISRIYMYQNAVACNCSLLLEKGITNTSRKYG
jgi:hypothetical protein